MSEGAAPYRDATLARFEAHRRAWDANPALRALYGRWYEQVARALPGGVGPFVEIGSGPGFAREFIPEMQLTDVVKAPWHDCAADAEALPYDDGSLGGLVLFDVLHHLPSPARFFSEASRTLRPGGRVVLCEPYVSWLSYPIYRWFHEERLQMGDDPWTPAVVSDDPFDANQAIPTLLFERRAAQLAERFPSLRLVRFERLAGPSYPASGGFSRGPLLPLPIWKLLVAVEDRLPQAAFRWLGFRLLAVVERVAS